VSADNSIQDRMTKLAGQLLERTSEGQISWGETDNEDEFIYSGVNNSVTIRRLDKQTVKGRYVLSVRNWRGTLVESLQSDLIEGDFISTPAKWNTALSNLYEEARRNALDVEKVLDDLISELGNSEEKQQPDSES
jgi:hypothetical protein